MGKLNFTISLDDGEITDRLRRSLKDGMRDSADALLDAGDKTAKNAIQKRGRVWRRELLNSFEQDNDWTGSGRKAVLRNVATHAAPVEYGAKYGARGPPVAALIPWVISKWNPGDDSSTQSGGGGTSGGAPKSSTARSKQFSTNRKLRSPSDTKNYNRISDEIWSELDIVTNDEGQLDRLTSESLEIKLNQHPDLDASSNLRVVGDVKSWKEDSRPTNSRVTRYAANVKTAFGITGEARGNHDEPLTQADIDAIRTIAELSRTNLKENVFDGQDTGTVYRGLTRETGKLTAEILDNPSADSWTIDVNALENYSTKRSKTEMFDRGFLIERDINIDEDVVNAPDFLFMTRNRSELELHLKGGDDVVFDRAGLKFIIKDTDWQGTGAGREYVEIDSILNTIESDGFGGLFDEELRAFNRLVNQMNKYDLSVSTPAGQNRLADFRDTFVDRGLVGRYVDTDEEFIERINGLM